MLAGVRSRDGCHENIANEVPRRHLVETFGGLLEEDDGEVSQEHLRYGDTTKLTARDLSRRLVGDHTHQFHLS
ncbi:MAG TPA: hypothetical protein VII50_04445 [Acidothermaceae bacterium]